jgi:DNA modification methylase
MIKTLPDESVQMCCTSPPYYGLRDYQTPPLVWDGDPNCEHEWVEHVQPAANGIVHDGGMSGETLSGNSGTRKPKRSDFCTKCFAWSGQYGLEPMPEMYIKHTVDLFRAVRRLLKSDGVLWLNLGDSYAGSWGNYVAAGSTSAKAMDKRRKDKYGTFKPPMADRGGSASMPPGKNLLGIPWRIALELQADGWFLRSAIVWAKPNGMPGSQDDRPTCSYEMIFLLSVKSDYYSDFDAIKTPPRESTRIRLAQNVQAQAGSHRANGGAKTNGPMKAVAKNDKQRGHSRRHAGFNERWDAMEKKEQQSVPAMIRDVWFVSPEGYDGAHFAVMPREIARRCILAGSRKGDTVLDPFAGSGTTLEVAEKLGRGHIGIELSEKYIKTLIEPRLANINPLFKGEV